MYRLLWEIGEKCYKKQNKHADIGDADADEDDEVSVMAVVPLTVSRRGINRLLWKIGEKCYSKQKEHSDIDW